MDRRTTGERPVSAIFRSPCGCRYLMPTGELLRSCEHHAPYGGTAFDAKDLLTRIESELGWPPGDEPPTVQPPAPSTPPTKRPGKP
jgi:hypothetical protein